jgi:serine/threonine-protein kinase
VDARDEHRLLSLASSISEGEPIDWNRVEREPGDANKTAVVRELQALDKIATFHRGSDASGMPTRENESDGGKADVWPQRWGHFTIIEPIGAGAFGCVYRAIDTNLQHEVALKLLWPASPDNPIDPSRALKEARLLARVRHPNVVTVYGTDLIDGSVGIWMELVKGRTFESLLGTHGPLSAREAALVGLDLCRALAAVHKAGLVHGDIKANNIMRAEGGRTVLMDFGTGKDVIDLGFASRRPSGDFAGTPLYLAPEVFEGESRTKSTDIYSLGVLLYHLVTDGYPVDGRTRAEVEQAHRSHARRHLRDVRPDLPEEFVHTVEHALALDPRDRYQSAGAFEASLAPFVGASVDRRHEPRLKRLLLAGLISVTTLVGGTVYWAAFRGPGSSRTPQRSGDNVSSEVAPSTSLGDAASNQQAYRISAVMFRVAVDKEVRLQPGATVAPGDRLLIDVHVSLPAYVYIVNEDEQGESYLLFPLPGQSLTNPLPSGTANRLPGTQGGQEIFWQVTSAGGREHFLIFASPERLPVLEKMFAALPRAEAGRPIQSARLSRDVVGALRSVGGLAPAAGQKLGESSLTSQFSTPLRNGEEMAHGLWVRQLTLDNPIP